MKLRLIKLTPESLIALLQGKASPSAANLPADTELYDLKLDLFNKQVLAIIRSDSFEDVAESATIPELSLKTAESKTAPASKPVLTPKVEPKQEVKARRLQRFQAKLP